MNRGRARIFLGVFFGASAYTAASAMDGHWAWWVVFGVCALGMLGALGVGPPPPAEGDE